MTPLRILPILAVGAALLASCGAKTMTPAPPDPLSRSMPEVALASELAEPSGVVVFASDRDGDWEIYAVNADGTGLRRLTDNEADDTDPVGSPDGSHVAFVRRGEAPGSTMVVRAVGGGEITLAGVTPSSGEYAWSADGELAVIADEATRIAIFDEVGARKGTVTCSSSCEAMSWAPDNALLAVLDGQGVGVFDAAGARTATVSCAGCGEVSWSPDGRIVTLGWDEEGTELYELVALETGARVRLPAYPETWSPEGQRFAFVRFGFADSFQDAFSSIDVVVADLESLEERTVTSMEVDVATYNYDLYDDLPITIAWSPAADLIALAAARQEAQSEIYTIDVATGNARQLTRARGGESATRPGWSPDGAQIFFFQSRFRPQPQRPTASDVATIGADGANPRRVTSPFPDGGTNVAAAWLRGSLEPLPPSATALATPVVLEPAATLATRGIDQLAADRSIAVGKLAAPGASCGPVTAWAPLLGRSLQLSRKEDETCIGETDALRNLDIEAPVHDLGIAGRRVAWVYSWEGPGGEGATCILGQRIDADLEIARPLGRLSSYFCKQAIAATSRWDRDFDGLRGDGSLFVHTSWRCPADCDEEPTPTVRRIGGGRTIRLSQGAAADVDVGRIVTLVPGDGVRLLDRKGTLLKSFGFGGATSAQLSGNDLVVIRDDALEVWDVKTGQRRAAYRFERGFGPVPVVEDVENGIAAVVIGVGIHLIRLSDGKDVVLGIPNQAGPSHAELEPAGLFYSWNEPYTRRPGRLAFVPWEDVVAAFDRRP